MSGPFHGDPRSAARPPGAGAGSPAGHLVPVGGVRADGALNGSMGELRRRRRELAERVAELTWDLGGLAYEMAIRDHYRLEVLARKAAELQEADAELAEVQRLLSGAEAGILGTCRSCGAVYSRGAGFCWQCGHPLQAEARPAAIGEPG